MIFILILSTALTIFVSDILLLFASFGSIFCFEAGSCGTVLIAFYAPCVLSLINVLFTQFIILRRGQNLKKWIKVIYVLPAILTCFGWNIYVINNIFQDWSLKKELKESVVILNKFSSLCDTENEFIGFNYSINVNNPGKYYIDDISVFHKNQTKPSFKVSDTSLIIDGKKIKISENSNKSLDIYKTEPIYLSKGNHQLTISYDSNYETTSYIESNTIRSSLKFNKLIGDVYRTLDLDFRSLYIETRYTQNSIIECVDKRLSQYYSSQVRLIARDLISQRCYGGNSCGCVLSPNTLIFYPNHLSSINECITQKSLYKGLFSTMDYHLTNKTSLYSVYAVKDEVIDNITQIKQTDSENYGVLISLKNQNNLNQQNDYIKQFVISGNKGTQFIGSFDGIYDENPIISYTLAAGWTDFTDISMSENIINKNAVKIIKSLFNKQTYPRYHLVAFSYDQPIIEEKRISEERLMDIIQNYQRSYLINDTIQEYTKDKIRLRLKDMTRNMIVDMAILPLSKYPNTYVISILEYYPDDINSAELAEKIHISEGLRELK